MKNKISVALDHLSPEDLKNRKSREKFLDRLPSWIFGTGGNTSCVSVSSGSSGEEIIFDAGSGLRELGIIMARKKPKPLRYHLFLSHYHWDHLQGFPYFVPAYDPRVTVSFYSPMPGLESALRGQMCPPYFPVNLDAMACKKNFIELRDPVTPGGLRISFKKMSHPGTSYTFLVEEGERRFLYATDTELSEMDFVKDAENRHFFKNVDVAVVDAQYTLEEAINKYNWGHNSFSIAVDFAATWGIKRLVLFHHDPSYDDQKLFNILQAARGYREKISLKNLEITLAVEGLEIVL